MTCGSSCRNAISAWCRRTKRTISTEGSTRWPTPSKARSILRPCGERRRRRRSRPAVCRGGPRPAHRPRARSGVLAMYPHLLESWRLAGAEILPFSPLADEAPDQGRMSSGCPAAIPSCMAACWPRRAASRMACISWGHARCRSWRVRRLHGAGAGDRGRRGTAAFHGRVAAGRDLVRQAPASHRLSPRASPTARWDRPARRSWDMNSTMPACCSR